MKKCAMSSGLCPDYTKARAPSGVTCRTLFNYLERANNGVEAVAYIYVSTWTFPLGPNKERLRYWKCMKDGGIWERER